MDVELFGELVVVVRTDVLLELVVGIEEEFGLVIGDDEFDVKHFETVGALSAFIRAKQG